MKHELVPTKRNSKRVQFTVNGKAVDSANVTFLVNGTKLKPERVQAGLTITINKLKPERVQAGFKSVAKAFRYASRARLRKAMQSFHEAIEIFEQVAKDVASFFDPTIEIVLTEGSES